MQPVHVPQTPYFSLIPDVAPCLIEIAATKSNNDEYGSTCINVIFVAEFAEVLIHLLENFYEVSPEIPMQRLNLVVALVSDLAINGKDMTNLLEAGFIYFIKGQLKEG